ncbi:MAG: DUF1993 family protein [Gammaproteobacteria bacterium]
MSHAAGIVHTRNRNQRHRARKLLLFVKKQILQFMGPRDIEHSCVVESHERSAQNYPMNFALPNIYFHTVTACDILRHNGVVLGKADYMGVRTQAGI